MFLARFNIKTIRPKETTFAVSKMSALAAPLGETEKYVLPIPLSSCEVSLPFCEVEAIRSPVDEAFQTACHPTRKSTGHAYVLLGSQLGD